MKSKFILLFVLILKSNYIYSDQIIVFSILKSGTHLLTKCIELLTNKKLAEEILTDKIINNGLPISKDDSQFFRSHLQYIQKIEQELEKQKFKVFFIYRDPRDQIISHAYWIKKLYSAYKNYTIDQLITNLIKCINLLYPKYLPWCNSKIICTIKFENLIGPKGNGDLLLQKKEIHKICKYLNINSKQLKKNCIKNLFGNSATFREGKIGSWKQYFTPEQKELFKKIAGNLLIELGYEKDSNW